MATKPTGRPRGRPRKSKSTPAKRARGRPAKPIADDFDRYLLALFQKCVDHGGFSERKLSETFVALAQGRFIESDENSAALLNRGRFLVRFERNGFARGAASASWRGKNAFRPLADNIHRKFRKIRRDKNSAQWLDDMSLLFGLCFEGAGQVERAAALAERLGEGQFFEERLQPILLGRDARFARVRNFLENGDVGYWERTRLRAWPNRTVREGYGNTLK